MPYAYGAKIEHEFDADHLNVWLTFRFPMETTSDPLAEPVVHDVLPPLELWELEADEVAIDIVDSAWQDEFTLLLTSDAVGASPERVLLEYAGPNSNLQTTWGKDWEPWGPKLSTDIGKAPVFVDRGDPPEADWTEVNFINDNLWHDLNLSSIVPAGVKGVSFTITMNNSDVGNFFFLRKNGNAGSSNRASATILVADISHRYDLLSACDADQKVEYRISASEFYHVWLTVKGWWF